MSAGLLLARHGQTADNAGGLILGHRDPPLSELGRAQASDLAESVRDRGLRSLWSSPLLRARETADIVGAVVGLRATVVPELIESARGRWEGQPVRRLAEDEPELHARFVAGDRAFCFPDGESLDSQLERTRAALAGVSRAAVPALVIAHAGTIRATMRLVGLELPPESALPTGAVALGLCVHADGTLTAAHGP